jgi:hypothetical protein
MPEARSMTFPLHVDVAVYVMVILLTLVPLPVTAVQSLPTASPVGAATL